MHNTWWTILELGTSKISMKNSDVDDMCADANGCQANSFTGGSNLFII